MPIKPPLPRHTVQQLSDGIQITLPSRKNYFRVIWYGLWLIMWSYITGVVLYVTSLMTIGASGWFSETGRGNGTWIFVGVLAIMLLFMFGMGIPVIYSFLWQVVGKEAIFVNNSVMSVSRRIFGWKKVSEYALTSINDLRASLPQRALFAPARIFQNLSGQNGIVAFDYGAKTIRFGLEIDEAEAKQIVFAIQEHLSKSKTG